MKFYYNSNCVKVFQIFQQFKVNSCKHFWYSCAMKLRGNVTWNHYFASWFCHEDFRSTNYIAIQFFLLLTWNSQFCRNTKKTKFIFSVEQKTIFIKDNTIFYSIDFPLVRNESFAIFLRTHLISKFLHQQISLISMLFNFHL